ncbi:MAG: hypothetical protein AAFU73_13340 [Planctomycetota bacterium]
MSLSNPAQAASRAAATPLLLRKVPLYAFRNTTPSVYGTHTYRAIHYSVSSAVIPGTEFVGPVGSLYEIGSAPVGALPLVQITQVPPGSNGSSTSELQLAPAEVGTPEFQSWLEGCVGETGVTHTVLGAALPPDTEPPAVEVTSPLLCARFTAADGQQLADAVTTRLDVYADLVNGVPNAFATFGPGAALGSIAQIVPTFVVAVDEIGGEPVAMVEVGIKGPKPGDIEVPAGPGTLIDFQPRAGADVQVENVLVTLGSGPAEGFDVIAADGTRVLVSDTADEGLYEYTLEIKDKKKRSHRMDPRLRNRATIG